MAAAGRAGHGAGSRAYLAHLQHPVLVALVYEAVDDEARLAVQLEVGGLHGGQVGGGDPLVHGEKGNWDVGLSKPQPRESQSQEDRPPDQFPGSRIRLEPEFPCPGA